MPYNGTIHVGLHYDTLHWSSLHYISQYVGAYTKIHYIFSVLRFEALQILFLALPVTKLSHKSVKRILEFCEAVISQILLNITLT